MPNKSEKTPNPGQGKPLPIRPRKPAKSRFDPRNLGSGKPQGKIRGGRPPLFPGRTGGR